MIIEALQHLFFKAPKHIKSLGYVKEAIAIDARYKRCRAQWQSHIENCHKHILTAAKTLPQGSQILILGSGALYDVPLKKLLGAGHKLTCVDIVQKPALAKSYPDVTFLEKDLTGIAKDFYRSIEKSTPYGGKIAFRWELPEKPALVISLNLLSQLPLAMEQYAERKGVPLHEKFGDNIMSAHLNWLTTLNTKILVIADVKRDYYYAGNLVRSELALPDIEYIRQRTPEAEWLWNISPVGEAADNIRIEHLVGCWKSL